MTVQGKPKVAIVGAGAVGATIAYACLLRGVCRHLVLYDINRAEVEAQCLDLNHGLQFLPMAYVEGSDDPAIYADSDVVIIAAGAKQTVGQTRLDLAAANVAMCRKLIPEIVRLAPKAILLLVSNPVDLLTFVSLKLSGLPPQRVIGSGTVLDSSRFRFLIARRCNVDIKNVHACIAGEHGDSEIPLWSSASIAGIPLHEWAVQGHGKLTVRDRTEIFENVKNAGYQILQGKGMTNYAIGLATTKILETILRDENGILPVSALVNNFHGINDVCLSVPRIVNAAGVEPALPISLNPAEEAGLQNSAAMIKEAIGKLGF